MTNELIRAYRFFRHKTGCVGMDATVALAYARAELAAEDEGIELLWEPEEYVDEGNLCQCKQCARWREEHDDWEVYSCRAVRDGETLASCGMIDRPDRDYMRVMGAELASEALDTIAERESSRVPSV